MVLGEFHPLPFGEGMHHLRLGVAELFDGEGDGALHAVEVVIDAQTLQDEEGCRDAAKAQLGAEVLLEKLLYQFDALLCLHAVEKRAVACRFDKSAHYRMVMYCLYCLPECAAFLKKRCKVITFY